jgi:hypothetical protein
MNPLSYDKYQKLLSGVFSMSLKEIIASKGEMPLPSGQDYYQGITGEEEDGQERQILIRKGSDLKKRKRSLRRILEGESVGLTDQVKFICTEAGVRTTTLEVAVNEEAVGFFREQVQGLYKDIISFLENSDLYIKLDQKICSKPYNQARDILEEVLEDKAIVFYFYDLQEQDKNLVLSACQMAQFTVFLGTLLGVAAEDLPDLCHSAIFDTVGSDLLADETLPAITATEQKLKLVHEILSMTEFSPRVSRILDFSHQILTYDSPKSSDEFLAQIIQTLRAVISYVHLGTIAIGDFREIIKAKHTLETCFLKLVIQSNPKINASCPEPKLHEISVNQITTTLGFSHLLERERQIRSDILKKCAHTNCLLNRASVVCHFEDYSPSFVSGHPFCEGQGPTINIFGENGKATLISKCNKGGDILTEVNKAYKLKQFGS